jgi:hypothetical protein
MLRCQKLLLTIIGALAVSGCSEVEPESQAPEPEVAKPKVRQEIFELVYRSATELKVGQEVGMNREKFKTLLQQFATELTIAKDKTESPEEQLICTGYSDVLAIYKDAGKVWDVKISVPSLNYNAEARMKILVTAGNIAGMNKGYEYQNANIDGIPLDVFPEGKTGLDDIAARYAIPIKEDKGWKTIPNGSVQLLWAKAKEKNAEVDTLRKK